MGSWSYSRFFRGLLFCGFVLEFDWLSLVFGFCWGGSMIDGFIRIMWKGSGEVGVIVIKIEKGCCV